MARAPRFTEQVVILVPERTKKVIKEAAEDRGLSEGAVVREVMRAGFDSLADQYPAYDPSGL